MIGGSANFTFKVAVKGFNSHFQFQKRFHESLTQESSEKGVAKKRAGANASQDGDAIAHNR